MMNKTLLVICDGVGDRPVKEFGGMTPLEAAITPNLDRLAKNAVKGMMFPLGIGKAPGSAVAHLAIFGYDLDLYYTGRGCIEAAGLGMKLKDGDIALRGNIGTVDSNLNIIDRRAGRIDSVNVLASSLDGMIIDDVHFSVRPGIAHRVAITMSGRDLSSRITDGDPKHLNMKVKSIQSVDDSKESVRTANILNKFLEKSHNILNSHNYNIQRVEHGELPGNYILVRGAGHYKPIPSFQEKYNVSSCCITGGGLYRGIGSYLGMTIIDVPGATGKKDSDIFAKFRSAVDQLKKFDFVFVHIKATDNAGHDGNFMEKKEMIEKIDRATSILCELPSTLLILTGDHSTPCSLKEHSADPVPIMFQGDEVRADRIGRFSEIDCMRGGMGHINGSDIMPIAMGLLGKTHVFGA